MGGQSLKAIDQEQLFYGLLKSEDEADCLELLASAGLMNLDLWCPLGDMENNFGIVHNQQSDPTGAMVEKIINSIDANLMAACYTAGIDPESKAAPRTMADAVEQFYGVRKGRIGDLTPRERTQLADLSQLVAVGSRTDPSFLVIDHGEGQTPASFPDTFMSLAKSNKLRIPFVQGKFNAGGTGALPFCGTENVQLIVSRRHPDAPNQEGDTTASDWGYTVVRRLRPEEGEARRSSMYVYLAPAGSVPSFSAEAISLLPSDSSKNEPAKPYAVALSHGTAVKMYNYKWRAKSIATTEARYELEKFLHSPCLPFRVTETRDYRANYYSTTVSGVWASIDSGDDADAKVEEGFPASATMNLKGVGSLDYRIAVFNDDVDLRHEPHGVFFDMNGQVHGKLPSDFTRRQLEFAYLEGLLVSVDCTNMQGQAREDFFMASRDRVRRNETYDTLVDVLRADLRSHPGLRELNAARRARVQQQALDTGEDVAKTLNDIVKTDPALQALFKTGDRVVTGIGPTAVEDFKGLRFPTFFNLKDAGKDVLRKKCPLNRTCRVAFVTDAVNDYFTRTESPGTMTLDPVEVFQHERLWNGDCSMRFAPPEGAQPGDQVAVSVLVTDPERESGVRNPFVAEFVMEIVDPKFDTNPPGTQVQPKKPQSNGKGTAPRLAIPNVTAVREAEWGKHTPAFSADEAFRVRPDGEGGHDFYINLDCKQLITFLKASKEDQELIVYWFKWGLTLCALGMMQAFDSNGAVAPSTEDDDEDTVSVAPDWLEIVNRSTNGIAPVIIPIIRSLYKGAVA
jgi:hypothetical protein